MIERPCNCPVHVGLRLAVRAFFAFLAVMLLFGFLHRNDGRGRILIETVPAAYLDQCGRVHRDLLDPRPGEPMFPIKRRGSDA